MRDRRSDELLAVEFRARYQAAKLMLGEAMTRHGLRTQDGWRIGERTKIKDGKTEIILYPIHLHLPTPGGLECVICIDEGGNTEANCAAGQ